MEQVIILITGVLAIYLSEQKNEKLKRYACIFGLVAQPFWFYATYVNEQWGIFISCFMYTASWSVDFYNNWIKK